MEKQSGTTHTSHKQTPKGIEMKNITPQDLINLAIASRNAAQELLEATTAYQQQLDREEIARLKAERQ